MMPFFCNVYITARAAPKVTVERPVGLRRARSSGRPRARRRATTSRRSRASARSRPAFDLNHPEAGIPVGIGPAKDAPEAPVVRRGRRRRSSSMRANAILFWILDGLLRARRGRLRATGRAARRSGDPRHRMGRAPSPSRWRRCSRRSSRSTSAGCTRRRAPSFPKTDSMRTSTTATPSSGSSAPGAGGRCVLAAGVALMFLGLAIGFWIAFIGGADRAHRARRLGLRVLPRQLRPIAESTTNEVPAHAPGPRSSSRCGELTRSQPCRSDDAP